MDVRKCDFCGIEINPCQREPLCQDCVDLFDSLFDDEWGDVPDDERDDSEYYLALVDRDTLDRCTYDWLQQNY